MQAKPLTAPPLSAGVAPGWRDLVLRGKLVQRGLWSLSELKRAADERGVWISLGEQVWQGWDELGVLRPVAFDHGELRLDLWPPADPGNTVFRDEDPHSAWLEHAVKDEWGYEHVHARYSPWQILLLADVATGADIELPIADLLQPERVDLWRRQVGDWWRSQYEAWLTLDARWGRAIRLLTELEARFWPAVSGRINLPFASGKGRVDPFTEERKRFDPLEVLMRHEIEPEGLAALYEWLVSRGARIEGGSSPKTIRGDGWARLRLLAARSERGEATRENELQRPVVRFVADRIALPLGEAAFR